MNARWHVTPRFASFIDNKNKTCSGTIIALSSCKKQEKGGGSYDVDTLMMLALFLTGTTLWAGVAVRGMQRALLVKPVEHGLNGIKAEGMHLTNRR